MPATGTLTRNGQQAAQTKDYSALRAVLARGWHVLLDSDSLALEAGVVDFALHPFTEPVVSAG